MDPEENSEVVENPEPEEDADPVGAEENASAEDELEENIAPEADAQGLNAAPACPVSDTEEEDSQAEAGALNQEAGDHLPEDEIAGTQPHSDAVDAEADQYVLNDANQVGEPVSFAGAEWSLEPEDAIISQSGPYTGAEYEAESQEIVESLATESSQQLAELGAGAAYGQLTGTDPLSASRGEDSGASAANATQQVVDADSSPEEEDFTLAPEEEGYAPEAGGYVYKSDEEETEPAEADQGLEGTSSIREGQAPTGAGVSDVQVPVGTREPEGQPDPSEARGEENSPVSENVCSAEHMNLEEGVIHGNQGSEQQREEEDCSVAEAAGSNVGLVEMPASPEAGDKSVPEDEISASYTESPTRSESKVADAESYAPECDQSSESTLSSVQSSPDHSSASGELKSQSNASSIQQNQALVNPDESLSPSQTEACQPSSLAIPSLQTPEQTNSLAESCQKGHESAAKTESANTCMAGVEVCSRVDTDPNTSVLECSSEGSQQTSPIHFVSLSSVEASLSTTNSCDIDQLPVDDSGDETRVGEPSQTVVMETSGEGGLSADSDTGVEDSYRTINSLSDGSLVMSEAASFPGPQSSATSQKFADSDLEEELLSELDATLQGTPVKVGLPTGAPGSAIPSETGSGEGSDGCDQCVRTNVKCSLSHCQGRETEANSSEVKELKRQVQLAKQLLLDRECEINRLKEDLEDSSSHIESVMKERDDCKRENESLQMNKSEDLFIPQIKELEYTIAQQQTEVRSLKDKLSSHDTAAKRAISTLQQEMKLRIDQVTKMYEDVVKEKDSMVVKFAQAEHKNLEFLKQAERAEMKWRELEKERESFNIKLNALKEQRSRMAAELDNKTSEFNSAHREVFKQKELVSSADVRVKWAQNKLKAELEAHKETKTTLDKTLAKLKEAKEETQQIRHDCQAIIKTYQESEEVKSNSLDKELKLKESELLEQQQKKSSQELAHMQTQKELENTREELRNFKTDHSQQRERIAGLEEDQGRKQSTIQKYEEMLQRQKKEVNELRDRIESLVQVKGDFLRAQELIKTLDTEIADLKISNKDLVAEMDACHRRDSNRLELTEKLSAKNADLQSENTNLSNKVIRLTAELQTIKMEQQETDTKLKDVSDQLQTEQKQRQEETGSLNTKLAGKTKAVEDLSRKVDEERDEIKTLKRKHANNIKDLTRQLQQVRRKLESYEVSTNGERDTTSMGSRTSSNGSLNTIGLSDSSSAQTTPSSGGTHNHNMAPAIRPSAEEEYTVVSGPVEVDKQMLIERIVGLQRAHARKNEKIDFMEDHISQLVDEIQKKNKVIQNYIMREETGTMTSDRVDRNKAELSRKHSIMASLYSSHSTDGTMTLDLSLEINRKLQAVLEDTLLKNITLKESLDTLGQEIARLSQENRSLQLHLQGKSRGKGHPATRR